MEQLVGFCNDRGGVPQDDPHGTVRRMPEWNDFLKVEVLNCTGLCWFLEAKQNEAK